MKILSRLICCLTVSFALLEPLKSQPPSRPLHSEPEPQLALNTAVVTKRYCSGSPFLMLTLSLRFTNLGDKPILIDTRSKLIGRYTVSRNLKDAVERKYLQKVSPMLDLAGAGFNRKVPEDLTLFTVLKPGESYSTSNESRVDILVGGERESLQPGKYLLQVRVITWYYYPQDSIDRLRVRWQVRGFLWTKDVISEPMTFEVESKPTYQPCPIH